MRRARRNNAHTNLIIVAKVCKRSFVPFFGLNSDSDTDNEVCCSPRKGQRSLRKFSNFLLRPIQTCERCAGIGIFPSSSLSLFSLFSLSFNTEHVQFFKICMYDSAFYRHDSLSYTHTHSHYMKPNWTSHLASNFKQILSNQLSLFGYFYFICAHTTLCKLRTQRICLETVYCFQKKKPSTQVHIHKHMCTAR